MLGEAMTSRILVTGGTGTLGRHVVRRLRDAGCDLRVLTRHSDAAKDGIEFMTGELTTGQGIAPAVDGVETIVHLAGSAKGEEDKARNLVQAASRAAAPHLVYISVVGAERIPVVSGVDRAMFGYFASKRAAEKIVEDSGLPWTTLRATQFHDLMLMVARPRVRHRRAARVRDERASPQLPAGQPPTPPHLAAPVARQGGPRNPGRR